jgi:hypothetical protein
MTDSTQIADKFLLESTEAPDEFNQFSQHKNVAYSIDLNQGSYSSGQVIFDLTNQLNGSSGFASLRDSYIVFPYVVAMKNPTSGSQTAAANAMSVGFKCNLANIIDRVQVEINGKTIVNPQNYLNFANNLRVMTEWSQEDLAKWGATSLVYPDDVNSIGWNDTANTDLVGDGYYNNGNDLKTRASTTATAPMFACNTGFAKRLLANANVSGANTFGWNSLTAANSKATNQAAGRSSFVAGVATDGTAAGVVMGTWYTMVKLRLIDLHPLFRELDLIQNPQIKLTLFVNTGVAGFNNATDANKSPTLTATTLTSGNTCPIMIASAAKSTTVIVNTNADTFAAAATVSNTAVSFGVLNGSVYADASAFGSNFPFSTCRIYTPFYDIIDKQALIERPIKTSNYIDVFTQSFKGQALTRGANFQLQLSANLKNLRYLAVFPFANSSVAGAGTAGSTKVYIAATNLDQYASPFDSAPWTCCPGASVTNYNVMVGNQWVYNNAVSYEHQNFIEEFSKINAINGGLTHYLSNGLIDEYKWTMAQSILLTDLSRCAPEMRDVPQSILIQGTNGCDQGLDFVVIAGYERSITINKISGEVVDFS